MRRVIIGMGLHMHMLLITYLLNYVQEMRVYFSASPDLASFVAERDERETGRKLCPTCSWPG